TELTQQKPSVSPPPETQLESKITGDIGEEPDSAPLAGVPARRHSVRRKKRRSAVQRVFAVALMVIIGSILGLLIAMPDLPRAVFASLNPTPPVNLPVNTDSPRETEQNPTATLPVVDAATATQAIVETDDVFTATPEAPQQTPTEAFTPTATPLGGGQGQIAFVSDRSGIMQIWLMNADGSNQKQLTSMNEGACQPNWSPDGSKLAFISPCRRKESTYPGAKIFILDLANNNQSSALPVPPSPSGDFDPAWSPDGTRIAFTSLRTGRPHIFLYNLETGNLQELSATRYFDRQPTWSPSGIQIAFVRTAVFDQIWIMTDSGMLTEGFTFSGDVNNQVPVWSPDGLIIYYSQVRNNLVSTWLTALRYEDRKTSKEFRVPAENPGKYGPMYKPSISPDGYYIGFESWPDGNNHDIYRMAVNGSDMVRLTTDPGTDFSPAWRPAQ
ncbi:MAG: hypothetical protein AAGU05_05235, partial [Anaerolineaceae bacterium]